MSVQKVILSSSEYVLLGTGPIRVHLNGNIVRMISRTVAQGKPADGATPADARRFDGVYILNGAVPELQFYDYPGTDQLWCLAPPSLDGETFEVIVEKDGL